MPFWPRGRPFSGSVMLCLYRIYQEFCIRLECAMGLLIICWYFFLGGVLLFVLTIVFVHLCCLFKR